MIRNNKRKQVKHKKQNSSRYSQLEIQKTEYIQISDQTLSKINCSYLKKRHCTYMDDVCKPYSLRCKLKYSTSRFANSTKNSDSITTEEIQLYNPGQNSNEIIVIVLSDNKKCIYNNHTLIDAYAICKVVSRDGTITDVKIPAAYCNTCNQYIVLKKDFIDTKKRGVLLCIVEDHTYSYMQKHKCSYGSGESRIHQLGYNVIKEYDYTDKQRQIILANILENTNISKQEVLSVVDANISRHKAQNNYSDAVQKWTKDRLFVSQYDIGDCQSVILNHARMGKR